MMNSITEITSVANSTIKKIQSLNKKKGRQEHGLFLVEGIREIEKALASGLKPNEVLINTYWSDSDLDQFIEKCGTFQVFRVSDAPFEKVSYRSSVANAIATFPLFDTDLSNLSLPANPLILVLEGIEKPGNMGAIFRTADAAGVDAIIISDSHTDFYNPNVIRASLGTVFTVPFAITDNDSCLDFLKSKSCRIYATYLEGAIPHYDVDMGGGTAIVMGTEATGITQFWVENADQCIKIPMLGAADSLNVSTATAVATYEAIRQRKA